MDNGLNELNQIREKIADVSRTKERLTGQIESKQAQLEEIVTECRAKFGVDIEELPKLIMQMEEERNRIVAEAKALLGMS